MSCLLVTHIIETEVFLRSPDTFSLIPMPKYIAVIYKVKCIKHYSPKSIDEAVEILFKLLTCNFAPIALSFDKMGFVAKFHHTLGMWVRNCFGLWRYDCEIMDNYDPIHADFISSEILEGLWDKFKSECRETKVTEESYEPFKKLISIEYRPAREE